MENRASSVLHLKNSEPQDLAAEKPTMLAQDFSPGKEEDEANMEELTAPQGGTAARADRTPKYRF